MYCSNCGNKLLEGADVCLKCGKSVTNVGKSSKKVYRLLIGIFLVFFILPILGLIVTPIIMSSVYEIEIEISKTDAEHVIKAIENDMKFKASNNQVWHKCDYNFNTSECGNNDFINSVNIEAVGPSKVDLIFSENNEIIGGNICINDYLLEVNSTGEITDEVTRCS